MEKEIQNIDNAELDTAADKISIAINQSIAGYFDIFTRILSSTIWQSPTELGIKLIQEVAPREWEILTEEPSDSIEIKRQKEILRKSVIVTSSRIIGNLGNHASILQRFTTRLIVQEILAEALPSTDQDRIIATELMLGFRNWKRLLSTIATHDIVNNTRILMERPCGYIDEAGRHAHVITVSGHIDPIESIPELPIIHTQIMSVARLGPLPVIVSLDISQILLDESVLKRHDNVLPSSEYEKGFRRMMLHTLGNIPVYKRRSIGNQKQRPEPRVEWKPHGA